MALDDETRKGVLEFYVTQEREIAEMSGSAPDWDEKRAAWFLGRVSYYIEREGLHPIYPPGESACDRALDDLIHDEPGELGLIEPDDFFD